MEIDLNLVQNSLPKILVLKELLNGVLFLLIKKGFDINSSQKCTNNVSFNNNINYQLPYTFSKWENNWS